MRLVLGVEYDGSSFCGWQIQPNAPTVQGEIEKGLSQIAAEPIRVFCAGRTDTGVHATYQVVHFETGSSRPITAWVRGVNALISRDISVLWAVEVCDEFHARYSARRRTYRYLLMNRDQRPGLLKDKVGWYHKTLNIDSMISWDVNNGIARRSWARNSGAISAITRAMESDDRLEVTVPNIVDNSVLDGMFDNSR